MGVAKLPESQDMVEVGSADEVGNADEEASPPPGSARVDCALRYRE